MTAVTGILLGRMRCSLLNPCRAVILHVVEILLARVLYEFNLILYSSLNASARAFLFSLASGAFHRRYIIVSSNYNTPRVEAYMR